MTAAVQGAQGSGSANNAQSASANNASANPAVSSSTTINNMDELQKKAPQVFSAMMQGIAMQICQQAEDMNNQLIQLEKQYQQQEYGS